MTSYFFGRGPVSICSLFIIGVVAVIAVLFIPLIIQAIALQWEYPNLLPETYIFWHSDIQALDYLRQAYAFFWPNFLIALYNTLYIATFASLLAMVICLLAAFSLYRQKTLLRSVVTFFSLAPVLVSEFIIATSLFFVFVSWGLVGTKYSIVIAQEPLIIPYIFRLLMEGVDTLEIATYQHCRLLGIGWFRSCYHTYIVPLRFHLAVCFALGCLVSVSGFLVPFFIGNTQLYTVSTFLFSTLQTSQSDSFLAHLFWLSFVPSAMITWALYWFTLKELRNRRDSINHQKPRPLFSRHKQ